MAPSQKSGAKKFSGMETDAHASKPGLGAHQAVQEPTTNGERLAEHNNNNQMLDLSDIPAGFEKIRGENGNIYVVPTMLRMYMEDKLAKHMAAKTAVPTMKVRVYWAV